MKNDAKIKQGSKEGIYEAHQTVNGKQSWKSTAHAIWFVKEHNSWDIGDLNWIGGEIRGITSNDGTGNHMPYNVPNDEWWYAEGADYGWKKPTGSDDIIIQCVQKGKYRRSFSKSYTRNRYSLGKKYTHPCAIFSE